MPDFTHTLPIIRRLEAGRRRAKQGDAHREKAVVFPRLISSHVKSAAGGGRPVESGERLRDRLKSRCAE